MNKPQELLNKRAKSTRLILANVGLGVMFAMDFLLITLMAVRGTNWWFGALLVLLTVLELVLNFTLLPSCLDVSYNDGSRLFKILYFLPIVICFLFLLNSMMGELIIYCILRLVLWLVSFIISKKLKLHMLVIIAVSFAFCCMPIVQMLVQTDFSPFNGDKYSRNLIYDKLDDGTYAVSGYYLGLVDRVIVPKTYKGKNVTEIMNGAFKKSVNIKSVSLPDTITRIGENAFDNCKSLKTINIPNGVKTIDNFAFFKCVKLVNMTIPESVERIGNSAFSNCTKLENINIENTLPFPIGAEVIDKTTAKFIVPFSSIDIYRQAEIWSGLTVNPKIDENQVFVHFQTYDSLTYINTLITNKNSLLTKPEDLVKDRYTFKGWGAVNGGMEVKTFPYTLTESTTLYAVWLKNYYLTYYLNDGVIDQELLPFYTMETPTYTLPIPSREGYEFKGWENLDNGNMIQSIVLGSMSDYSLSARWLYKYRINYDLAGGEFTTLQRDYYTVETPTIILATPVREGYEFAGWYTAADFQSGSRVTQITIGSTVDYKFYAKWLLKYDIEYFMNGGTFETAQRDYYTVETPEITLATPLRAGYSFAGWWTTPTFDAGTKVVSIANGSTGGKHFYAKWLLNYTITYDFSDGTFGNAFYTVETETFNLTTPQKEGFIFKGWFTEPTFVNNVTEITVGTTGNKVFYAKWIGLVTFNYAGATGGNSETFREVELNKVFGALAEPTRTGYEFAGWYTKANGEGIKYNGNVLMTDGHIILYAKWLKIYKITYNLNGGQIENEPLQFTVESATITLPLPTKDNFTFDGWYTESGFINKKWTIERGTSSDITVYAKWIGTVKFNYQGATGGNTLINKQVIFNSQFGELPSPTRLGYSFEGWYSAVTGGININALNYMINGNIEIFARWKIIDYSITYNINGGNLSGQVVTYNINSENIVLAEPAKNYYIFRGWYDNAGFIGNLVTNIPNGSAGNKQYYAKWEAVEYTITYNVDGGNLSGQSTSYNIESENIVLAIPTKDHYIFRGWYDNAGFIGNLVTNIPSGSVGNKEYYAKWETVEYTITYNLDGGSLSGQIVTYNVESENIVLAIPTKDHYTFMGWYDNAGFIGNLVTNIPSGSVGNKEYYAKWEAVEYTITYNVDGGNLSGQSTSYNVESENIVLAIPTKDHYTFMGWYDNAGFIGNLVTNIPNGSVGNKEYYAKWETVEYTITYNLDGGSLSGQATSYTVESENIVLAIPTKENYTFSGWFTNPEFTGEAVTLISGGSSGDKNFYAKWLKV